MARIRLKSGTEGPSHDPYGWTELHLTRTDGVTVTYRYGGLGYERVLVNGVQVGEWYEDYTRKNPGSDLFEQLTGIRPEKAEEIPSRLEQRKLRKMTRSEREQYYMHQRWEQSMLANCY